MIDPGTPSKKKKQAVHAQATWFSYGELSSSLDPHRRTDASAIGMSSYSEASD